MDKNKKDYLPAVLLYQMIVCILFFGVLFGLNYYKPNAIDMVKMAFFDKLQDNDIVEMINKTTDEKDPATSIAEVITTTENSTEVTENESIDALIPSVSATGGLDSEIKDKSDAPANVSVNNYSLNQKMILPLKGTITSEFGARVHPIRGSLSYHSGIDIAAESGTPIKAAFNGVVIESEYDQWNGYHIKIQHDNGVMTVYCHCNELLFDKGAIVEAGETIATVGSTGSSTGPHLHFELRINDICYDPQPALNEAVNAV